MRVKDKRGFDTTIPKFELRHRGDYLAIGEEKEIRVLNILFSELVLSSKLEELVKKYNSLQQKIKENEESEKYYEQVDKIWNGIYQNGELLNEKGKCRYCPQKSMFDYF